jgi:hypothetical protein
MARHSEPIEMNDQNECLLQKLDAGPRNASQGQTAWCFGSGPRQTLIPKPCEALWT